MMLFIVVVVLLFLKVDDCFVVLLIVMFNNIFKIKVYSLIVYFINNKGYKSKIII